MLPKIVTIVGRTAVGKSDIAVFLAKKFNGEIISADSRQVYKGLDIGSGKITKKEMLGIPHHLLDVANPKKRFTVVDFKTQAEKAIRDILQRGKLPIICGGTGFYIQAIVDNIVLPEVPENITLRKKLETQTTAKLLKTLEKLDSKRLASIDKQNRRRIIRAIEIATALGKVPKIQSKPLYKTLLVGIDLEDKKLRENIHNRLYKRMKIGMVKEAKKLHAQGISWKRMDELGLEYRYLAKYLKGEMTKKEMLEKLETEIWRFSRRQKTWFKKDSRIKWFKKTELKKIEKGIKTFLKK